MLLLLFISLQRPFTGKSRSLTVPAQGHRRLHWQLHRKRALKEGACPRCRVGWQNYVFCSFVPASFLECHQSVSCWWERSQQEQCPVQGASKSLQTLCVVLCNLCACVLLCNFCPLKTLVAHAYATRTLTSLQWPFANSPLLLRWLSRGPCLTSSRLRLLQGWRCCACSLCIDMSTINLAL